MINQDKLKSLLRYNPDTGVFIWLVNRNGKGAIKAGDVAGSDNGRGYYRIGVDGEVYAASRLAFLYMTGAFPSDDVDHINGDTKDNRWVNLRSVTHRDNMRNMRLHNTNTSGQTGVSFHRQYGKYHAYIHVERKRETIGYYDELSDAIAARKEAEIKHGYHENHGRAA